MQNTKMGIFQNTQENLSGSQIGIFNMPMCEKAVNIWSREVNREKNNRHIDACGCVYFLNVYRTQQWLSVAGRTDSGWRGSRAKPSVLLIKLIVSFELLHTACALCSVEVVQIWEIGDFSKYKVIKIKWLTM